MLMTGSSDGVIKIFRNYESPQDIELVTAFTALKNLIPSTKNAGIVLDWQQGQGKLLVAGDVKTIKVWNAATETYITVSFPPKPLPFPSLIHPPPLTSSPGHPRSLRLLHHLPNLRPSRRQHLRRRLRRRRHPHLRHASQTRHGHDKTLASPQTMDHKYPHAARRLPRTGKRQS